MSTREIILLRHAQANDVTLTGTDQERALSPHGEAEADAAGFWLKAQGISIDRVLCSPAVRAQQTLQRVLTVIGYSDLRNDPRIYEATPGDLLSVLSEHADAEHLILVGHNPGLERLAALLATGQSSDYRGMAPAGIAWFELPANTALEPGLARLKHFWSP